MQTIAEIVTDCTSFDFKDNAIVVTIPFNRLDLGRGTPSVTPQDTPQATPQDETDYSKETTKRILRYCVDPKSTKEIMEYLNLKDRKNLRTYIIRLLQQGRLAMTIPDKPSSKYQKYITIK